MYMDIKAYVGLRALYDCGGFNPTTLLNTELIL